MLVFLVLLKVDLFVSTCNIAIEFIDRTWNRCDNTYNAQILYIITL